MPDEPEVDTPLSAQLAELAKDVMRQRGLGHRTHEIDRLFTPDVQSSVVNHDNDKGTLV